jgi:DNA-binding transcriptional LysR family regulator
MFPTPRALALQEPIRCALQQLEDALSSSLGFDPATSEQNFLIAGSDYVSTFLMPGLARSVRPEAPGITLQMLDFPPSQTFARLSEGRVDVAVERGMEEMPEWIRQEILYRSYAVCIARRNHPVLRESGVAPGERIPAGIYCSIPHVILSTDGSKSGSFGPALRRLGLSRTVGITVPHFQTIALTAASSDLLGNVPIHLARYAATRLNLDIYLPPFDPPIIEMRMYWHRRLDKDPAQTWLRKKIASAMNFDAAYPPPSLAAVDEMPWDS